MRSGCVRGREGSVGARLGGDPDGGSSLVVVGQGLLLAQWVLSGWGVGLAVPQAVNSGWGGAGWTLVSLGGVLGPQLRCLASLPWEGPERWPRGAGLAYPPACDVLCLDVMGPVSLLYLEAVIFLPKCFKSCMRGNISKLQVILLSTGTQCLRVPGSISGACGGPGAQADV